MAKHDLLLLALNPSPVLDLMERALRAAGYEVAIVHDVEGLNRSLQESSPALVLIGEGFSGEDVFSFSEAMLERFPTLPILLYAEQDAPGMAKAVLKAGLSAYLHPPLKMDDIVGAVNKSMARARQLGDWLRHEVRRTTSSLAERAKISEAERTKLEAVIANIQDGVIVVGDKQEIIIINRSIRDIFNLDDSVFNGRHLSEVITNQDLQALLMRSSESPLKYHEVNFDDGRVFNAQYTPIPGVGAAITMQDISYLKELDRLKNDFVHTVSHDLRSPLTAVLGYTELIERTGPLSENQQEFLHRIQGSVQHITTLINDLLDLGRLEAGFDTRRESIQLEGVLRYTLDMFESHMQKKKITLTTNIAPNLHSLRANPIRIRQMMDNLVGNAIKYTPEGGTIRVGVSMEDNQIILEVTDSGPGIPTGEQNRVFDKFYRASNVPDGIGGSGLGLAIVKSIVDSHQGRVWVESNVGKGSSFFVVFPAHE
ncbi:MAG: PAS-domain containing protein [Chloroflexi bacterium]|nr:PAS-domain containing protein [Chloroflexota bacterium]